MTRKSKKPVPPKGLQRWQVWVVDVRAFAAMARAISKVLGQKVSKDGVLIIAPKTEDDEALALEIGDFLKAQP